VINYKYAAKGPGGKTVEGSISAPTKAEAVAELRKQNLIVMKLDASGGGGRGSDIPWYRRGLGTVKPSGKRSEIVIFTRQLATMVGAGLALLESLEVLAEQAESPGMKAACNVLITEVRGGSDLSAAMQTCPKAFTHLYISMVRAGEISGQMDVILNRLADYQEASEELSREIKSAMTYPVISMVLVLGITAFLLLGVVPTFKNVFESLDAELPAITRAVLAVSDFLRANVWAVAGTCVGLFMGMRYFKRTPQGARLMDRLSLKVPVFGSLFTKVCLARFSRTFATLIRSGGTVGIMQDNW
jgi:type IV pilus assembly protein PilC